MATNTIARVANDLGLAVWLGGTAREVVRGRPSGTDPSAGDLVEIDTRRWLPIAAGAMAATMAGATRLAQVNLPRVGAQAGVGRTAATKTAMLAGGAVATTAAELAAIRRGRGRSSQLLSLIATVLVGGAVVSDARLGEQQRPAAQAKGTLHRILALVRK